MIRSRGTAEFHPELRRYARVLPNTLVTRTTLKVLGTLPVHRTRKPTAGVEVNQLRSGIDLRLHRPMEFTPSSAAAVLWIHGGGYLLGDAAMDDKLCRRLARELGATVAAVDYRLAPAHPYPTPLHDCHDALAWLAAHDSIDPSRIAIAGASAGGGLAAALALLARERREIALAAQVLVYPMLDDRTAHRSDPGAKHRRMFNNTSNQLGWSAYLGDADPNIAVPARQHDLNGLAPAWIGVGTLDVLHDEAVTYANRLREAGVPCVSSIVRGAFHGFDAVAKKTVVASNFFSSWSTFLRSTLRIG